MLSFMGKMMFRLSLKIKKFLNFLEKMPLPIPSLFPSYSARLPELKTVSSLEAFARNMDRAVEHGQSMGDRGG